MALTVLNEQNPIKVTGKTSTSVEILGEFSIIRYVRWVNPTTAGHLCWLTNNDGDYIIKMNAEANNDTQQWELDTGFDGIHCTDMDSGELYIYLH